MIAALFVDPYGVYSTLPDIDLWGEDRDARLYTGDFAVVAHPPCQLWGRFAAINYKRWGGEHNKPGNDGGCFESALLNVERCGGVLEHPADSYAWEEYGIKKASGIGWEVVYRGSIKAYVCVVWQSAYGHLASKRTQLYYVGTEPPKDLRWDRVAGTHQIGQRDQRGKSKNKPTLSGKKASATPVLFAEELIDLARNSRGESTSGT